MSLDTLLEAAEFLEWRNQSKTRGMFSTWQIFGFNSVVFSHMNCLLCFDIVCLIVVFFCLEIIMSILNVMTTFFRLKFVHKIGVNRPVSLSLSHLHMYECLFYIPLVDESAGRVSSANGSDTSQDSYSSAKIIYMDPDDATLRRRAGG